MAVYGAFISAPLGHVLISILQRMFSGRTSLRAKILQILVSNLVVSISSSQHLSLIELLLMRICAIGLTHSEYCLFDFDGCYCGCQNVPSGPGDRSSRFYACDESQLGHLAVGSGVCPEIPAGADLGAIFQHCGLLYWHIY